MEEQLPYYPYSQFLKELYGTKVYKLPICLPLSCPNRKDGKSGCSFCSDFGTGFETAGSFLSVTEQLKRTRQIIEKKYKAKKFIAYFQNYTNTYLPLDQFRSYIQEAASVEDIVEIAVSTRPDCVREDYMDVLKEVQQTNHLHITVEFGLQTVNYHTLDYVNRGHGLAEYIDAVQLVRQYGFDVCTHVILNLPGDDARDAIETARILSALKTDIVKIHSLYIAKNTPLCRAYEKGEVTLCSKEEYLNRLRLFLENLDPKIAVERLFSRIPEKDAVFCNWGTSWWKLKDEFLTLAKEYNSFQGKEFNYLNGAALKDI